MTNNNWINHVKNFAKQNNISYKDALKNEKCKKSYKKKISGGALDPVSIGIISGIGTMGVGSVALGYNGERIQNYLINRENRRIANLPQNLPVVEAGVAELVQPQTQPQPRLTTGRIIPRIPRHLPVAIHPTRIQPLPTAYPQYYGDYHDDPVIN